MYQIFGRILEFGGDQMITIPKIGKISLDGLMPLVMIELASRSKKRPETAEGILDWIQEAILYIKGESDNIPKMDYGFAVV